jgi:MFS family permease
LSDQPAPVRSPMLQSLGDGGRLGSLRTSPWFMLAIITIAYICSGADRFVLTLLVVPIKAALRLSDTQVGLLQGLAFLFIYSVAGIPAGYFVDRLHRVRLLAASVVVWSAMTVGCAFAQQFVPLLIGRGGVAIGEATIVPTFYSLMADRFSPARRGMAIGLHLSVATLCSGGILLAGGALVAGLVRHGPFMIPHLGVFAPWQATLAIFGAPGLVIAPLVLLMKEPARHKASGRSETHPSVRRFYASNAGTLAIHHLAIGLCGIVVNAGMTWGAPFMMRVHGWTLSQVGPIVGLAFLGASVGLFGGGLLSDRLSRSGDRARFVFWGASAFAGAVCGGAFPLVADGGLAVALFGLAIFLANVPFGGVVAALNEIVDNRVRGTVAAIFGLTFSIFSSAGPLVVGILNDTTFRGHAGIQNSLELVVPTCFLVSGLLFLLLIAPFRRSTLAVSDEATRVALLLRSPGLPLRPAAAAAQGTLRHSGRDHPATNRPRPVRRRSW